MKQSFSQRKGLKRVKNIIQIDAMDDDLRNSLWNALTLHYWSKAKVQYLPANTALYLLCQRLWHSYFKEPIDNLPETWSTAHSEIREYFFDCEWNEIYDFIEFIADNPISEYQSVNSSFVETCNAILKREVSAYRFVSGLITEITSEEEITEIEEAVATNSSLKPVSFHLKRAVELLADRDSPDYRNSIKESISSVEAMCNLISDSSSATLTKALRDLDSKQNVVMHPALRGAFEKLYGYTSDAEGIRHSLLEESNLDFEDAKFMLVSCSAFINYLKSKASKAKIEL